MPEYSIILLFFLAVALYIQKQYKLRLFNNTIHLVVVSAMLFLVGVVWDHIAIGRGHWYFGEQYLLGPRIGLMPIEEYGFTLIMPYFVLVLYKWIEKKTTTIRRED